MVRIIHISDLHLESETPNSKQKNIINALIADLKNYVLEDSILIFSGDLIDKSGVCFTEYDLRFNFFEEILLERLRKEYPSLKGRILFVPGNHDLDRNKIDEFTDRPLRDKFIETPELVNRYIKKHRIGKKIIEGLKDYKSFEKDYAKQHLESEQYKISNFESSYVLASQKTKIGFSCLNSSWLCFDNDNREKLFIGEEQLNCSLEFITDCDIKIAVIHHPLNFLHSIDVKKIKPILYANYDLVLFGHTHKQESSRIDDLDGDLFVSIGKSINGFDTEHKDYVCGYSVLDFFQSEKIKVSYRKYINQHNKFVVNSDVGNDEGTKNFHIPQEGELLVLKKTRSIIDTINTDRIPKLNDDLILNISQSNKSSLSEIFVEPIIGNLPESNLNEQEEIKYFSSTELVDSDDNVIIFGSKEIGKTILLDKILVELTNNFSKSKRLPVKIGFSNIGNKSFKQLIRDFFLKSSQDLVEILDLTPIDLLIDDIDFSKDYEYQIKELEKFLKQYPKTRLIVTKCMPDDKMIPIDDITAFSSLVTDFNKVYLHLFKSKQIKGLVSNWISNSDLDLHQNIEKLIKGFRELGLPKTPLAVTMFLWIINKQQNRPINNAVLVEMFIENLLEKSKIDNIYFDTFDFGDKQRLLAYIAKFMLDKNNKTLNYRVKDHELSKEIEEYLKDKIDIKTNTVLNYLIEKGILIYCNGNSLQFKTAFFFNYFLAKYMSYDSDFKSRVVSGKNYLSFISELDFYTGLNREDVEVFDFIIKELNETFDYINNKVRNEAEIIDNVLETEDTISSRIDLGKVKQKPSEKEIEDIYDSQISTTPSNKAIEPKKELELTTEEKIEDSIADREYSKILKLASIVFKNSADIEPKKRKYAYENIILSSISFMMIYRDSILFYYKNNRDEISKVIPKTMNFGFFMKVLPIIHQTTMYNWVGSLKSAPIIRDKIIKDRDTMEISELEKFLSVYIYADIRGKDHPEFVEEFIKTTKRRFILDSSFIKNMSYYFLRSKTQESDNRYLRLLSEIRIKLGQTTKKNKGEFMQKLVDSKRKKNNE